MCLPLRTVRCKLDGNTVSSARMDLLTVDGSFAGSDSTASTMQSFFWHILDSTPVYQSILREIEHAVKTGVIPAQGNLTWNEAQNLTYLQACLKEAMRVRPAVGLNITRLVPPEGAELDGHFFPGGTAIACNGWVLHRDKEVFGQDADDFRPERWLEDEERAKRMERYMFQVGLPLVSYACWWLVVAVADIAPRSSEVEATCASAGTWPCLKSTRSCQGYCATIGLSWHTRAGRSRRTRPSSWCSPGWRCISEEHSWKDGHWSNGRLARYPVVVIGGFGMLGSAQGSEFACNCLLFLRGGLASTDIPPISGDGSSRCSSLPSGGASHSRFAKAAYLGQFIMSSL
jgi:hypothetical protein